MVRFLHTSDWQLGASMGQIPGDKGALLRAERLAALERIGAIASEKGADFILAAGDLFDAHTVENEVVTRALEILGRIGLPIYAIPGNHDFSGAPESVYTRQRFLDRCPENFKVLVESVPLRVPNSPVTLLPCPLVQRHTMTDPTRWLTSKQADTDPDQVRVAISHGSVVDFDSEDGGTTPNLINPAVADDARLDYLAMGDWHGLRRINEKAWYCGTPEPDRFKDNQSGHVLLVEIDGPGAAPRAEPIRSAGCDWFRHKVSLHMTEDVAALERWFEQLNVPQKSLVRLEYEGVLGMHDLYRLENLLDTQSELLLHLRRRGDGVQLKPTEAELESLGQEGLTGRVALSLRTLADRPGEESKAASLALQMLFQRARPVEGGSGS